jgi:hypothetical protein
MQAFRSVKNRMHVAARVTLALAMLLIVDAAATVAPGAVATLTATEDLCMGSAAPYRHNNEGAEFWFPIGDWGFDCRTILRFDVRSLGGLANLQVNSITLKLFSTGFVPEQPFASGLDNITPVHPEVHAISAANRGWVEGTGNGYNFVPWQTCYEAKQTGATAGSVAVSWAGSPGLTTAGVDYDSTVLATRSLLRDDLQTMGTEIVFTFAGNSAQLTGLINAWLSDNYTLSRANPGLVIFDSSAGNLRRANFFSLQCTNPPWQDVSPYPAAYQPQLVVSYTHAPEPGALTLLGTGLVGALAHAWRKRNSRQALSTKLTKVLK